MRLYQNQLWRQGRNLYRIVRVERLSVEFKQMDSDNSEKSVHRTLTKKEFCRLIKGAEEVLSEGRQKDGSEMK